MLLIREADRTTVIVASTFSRQLYSSENVDTQDRKSTRLNSSHGYISYAVFCLKKNQRRDGHSQHRRLRVFSETQVLVRPLKAELRQRRSQRRVRLFEHPPRRGVRLGQCLPHACELRALSGKQKCKFFHSLNCTLWHPNCTLLRQRR